jgi:hypothetical protein
MTMSSVVSISNQYNDGKPQVCSQDYLLAIGEGDVVGHSLFSKIGYYAAAGTSEVDVYTYGGTYPFLATAGDVAVVSSSQNDGNTNGAACTGVRVVTIHYLDATYAEKSVDVTLNGTTAVNTTAGDIFRVNDMVVKSFGTGTTTWKAIGAVACTKIGTASEVYAQIAIGATAARSLVYTVPLGKTLYVVDMMVGCTKAAVPGSTAVFTLKSTYDHISNNYLSSGKFFMPEAEVNHCDGSVTRFFNVPLKFPATTDIKMSVLAGQAATIVTASIRGWLE